MKSMRLQIHPVRAVVALAIMTLLAIASSTTVLLWDLRNRELEHSRLETVSLTHMFTDQTERYFEGADLVLQGVQERLHSSFGRQLELDSAPVHLLLGSRISGMHQVSRLFVTDTEGVVINSSHEYPPAHLSVKDRGYFSDMARADQDALVIDKPVRSRRDGNWSMHIARKLVAADGKFMGVVVATVDIPRFEQLYNFMKLDYVRPLAIYLADGTLVASVPHRENMIGDHLPELDAELRAVRNNDIHMVTHRGGDGSRQEYAISRVRKFPLLVSVRNDEEAALASWRETSVPIALGAALLCFFTAVVAAVLTWELAREARLGRALNDANNRFEQTIDSVMDAIVAIDGRQNIILFNPAAERMFDVPSEMMMGQPMGKLVPERMRERHAGHVTRFMRSQDNSRSMGEGLHIIGLRADGSEFPIESTISRTLIDGKVQLTAVLRDVSDLYRAEIDLREKNAQLRALSASLQEVREQERTRIARELHDDLGQQLTGLKLDLSWVGARLKEGRPPDPEKFNEMRQMLDVAISSVRRISTDLRPPILDDLGFGEAVRWHASEFGKRSGLDIALDLPAADLVKDEALATALFRIVQESLTNVSRHAQGTRVQVTLAVSHPSLLLTIHDNGQGIAADHGRHAGIGLASMRERAEALGGSLRVAPGDNGGTVVEVTLPLDAPVLAGAAP